MATDPAALALLAKLVDDVSAIRAAVEAIRSAPSQMVEAAASEPTGLLDVKGAAAHCHCSTTTIYRSAERGELRCLRAGARVRFTLADLDAWLRGERPELARLLTIKRGG